MTSLSPSLNKMSKGMFSNLSEPNTVQYIRRGLKGVKVNVYKSGTVEPPQTGPGERSENAESKFLTSRMDPGGGHIRSICLGYPVYRVRINASTFNQNKQLFITIQRI